MSRCCAWLVAWHSRSLRSSSRRAVDGPSRQAGTRLGWLSWLPFLLAFPDAYAAGNVVLTLLAGVVVCHAPPARQGWVLLVLACMAELCRLDYGAAGVLSVFVFWWVGERKGQRFAAFLLVGLLTAFREGVLSPLHGRSFQGDFVPQAFSVLAVWVALIYDGTSGKRWRGFFYLFYPVHLLILAAIGVLVADRF